jgi:biopolymer transport protein ExbD
MAISMNGGSGGGSRFGSRRRAGGGALSEINVTPFVDVVLVLLIIFMLTAHVMEYGIQVDVPQTTITPKTSTKDLPVIQITKTGDLYLNETATNIHVLKEAIQKRFPGTQAVYVRADKATNWEPIAQVTAELGEAKFQVNLVTQPADFSKGVK